VLGGGVAEGGSRIEQKANKRGGGEGHKRRRHLA
jgi:hypothetical protein